MKLSGSWAARMVALAGLGLRRLLWSWTRQVRPQHLSRARLHLSMSQASSRMNRHR
jgi:hypothetical protein